MNRGWMNGRLSEYLQLLDRYDEAGANDHQPRARIISPSSTITRTNTGQYTRPAKPAPKPVDDLDEIAADLRQREPTVKEVLKCLDPQLAEFDFDKRGGPSDARAAVQRGLGVLSDRDAWAENLTPDAPTLPADQLHPWAWEAARTLWESKHYREAVHAAATAINAHTQTKVDRRDISDTDLMNQVLAPKNPRPGQTYLQVPGDPDDRTVSNRNRALRPLAEGLFAGVRAPATHETGPDWPPQKALEALAAFSILAHWIEECEIVTAPT